MKEKGVKSGDGGGWGGREGCGGDEAKTLGDTQSSSCVCVCLV